MKFVKVVVCLCMASSIPSFALAEMVAVSEYFNGSVINKIGLLLLNDEENRQVNFDLPGTDSSKIPCQGLVKTDAQGVPLGFSFTCQKNQLIIRDDFDFEFVSISPLPEEPGEGVHHVKKELTAGMEDPSNLAELPFLKKEGGVWSVDTGDVEEIMYCGGTLFDACLSVAFAERKITLDRL